MLLSQSQNISEEGETNSPIIESSPQASNVNKLNKKNTAKIKLNF